MTDILVSSAARWGSLGLALGELILVFRLLLIPAVQNYYKSTVLSDTLQPKVDAIYQKTKDPKEAGQKVTKLLMEVRYPSLGMVTYLIIFIPVSLLLTVPLILSSDVLHSGTYSPGLPGLLSDVTVSPFSLLSSGTQGISTLTAFAAPLAVAAITYAHDRLFTRHSVVLRQNFDFLVLAAVTVGSVLLPAGFSICWFMIELIGILQGRFVRRFFRVQVKKRLH